MLYLMSKLLITDIFKRKSSPGNQKIMGCYSQNIFIKQNGLIPYIRQLFQIADLFFAINMVICSVL